MTIERSSPPNDSDPRGPQGRRRPTRASAVRIAMVYAVLSWVWIAVSGRLLHRLVHDPARVVLLEELKGWLFVSVTALLLGLMLDRQFRGIRRWANRIQESEAKLLLVSDNLPDSYVYQYAHEAGQRQFSYVSAGAERVHGVLVADVLRDAWCLFDQIDSAQRTAIAAAEADSARTLSDLDMEVRIRRADGQERLVRLRSRPRRGADGRVQWDGFASDVTDRRRAEAALQRSEENFRTMFELASIGIAEADAHTWRYLRVNRKLCAITGYSADELTALRIADLTHADDREGDAERLRALVRGDVPDIHAEKRYVRKDGTLVWVSVNTTLIRTADGEPARALSSIEDVTARKQLEAQLLQAQKMEAIGQLAGGVAHDFNNILGAILMQVELTSEAPNLPHDVAEGLQEIRASAQRAAQLTRQLLLFSRKQVMQPRDLDLNETVTSLAKMLQRIIGEDVRLQLRLHPAAVMVRADAGMIDQTLMNLAVNARDAMPEGGRLLIETGERVIDAEAARLQADASPGRHAWLSVSDTGCGIPADVLPRIFEPFFTTKEAGKGTGLGLATVFGIVKQHQGWITVDSQPGSGTRFEIFLPAAGAPALDSETTTGELGGRETVLLVEDDRAVRSVTRRILERGGYTVLEAATGTEALALWDAHRESIALLLTDLVMPGGISGQKLAHRLQEGQPGLKIVYTSGYSPEFAGRGSRLEHGENFVQKPCSADQLLAAIRRCLDA